MEQMFPGGQEQREEPERPVGDSVLWGDHFRRAALALWARGSSIHSSLR